MNKKRLFSLMLGVTMLMSTCTCKAEAPIKETASQEEPIVLKLMTNSISGKPYIQALCDEYTKLHPNVSFEAIDENPDSDYQTKLMVTLAGDDSVDIVHIPNCQIYSAAAVNGYLEDLTPYVERDQLDLDTAMGGVADNFILDQGDMYGMPFNKSQWLLFYNKNIYDEAGLPYPSDDMTWTEFEELADNLTKGEGNDKIYGAYFQITATGWESMVWNRALLAREGNLISEDYSFLKKGYEMIQRMEDKGTIIDSTTITSNSYTYNGQFLNGKVANMYVGSYVIPTIIAKDKAGELGFDWGIALAPHDENGSMGDYVGLATSMCINRNSKKKEAAWDFIKFATLSEEGAIICAQNGATNSFISEEAMKLVAATEGYPQDEQSQNARNKATNMIFEQPIGEALSVVIPILKEEHSLILTRSISLDEGIDNMNKRVTEALKEAGLSLE